MDMISQLIHRQIVAVGFVYPGLVLDVLSLSVVVVLSWYYVLGRFEFMTFLDFPWLLREKCGLQTVTL